MFLCAMVAEIKAFEGGLFLAILWLKIEQTQFVRFCIKRLHALLPKENPIIWARHSVAFYTTT